VRRSLKSDALLKVASENLMIVVSDRSGSGDLRSNLLSTLENRERGKRLPEVMNASCSALIWREARRVSEKNPSGKSMPAMRNGKKNDLDVQFLLLVRGLTIF
jgi:hypothetical protein